MKYHIHSTSTDNNPSIFIYLKVKRLEKTAISSVEKARDIALVAFFAACKFKSSGHSRLTDRSNHTQQSD